MGEQRLHLAYVVHTLNPGGTERLVVDMSLAFARSYRVTVFCLDEPGLWANTLRQEGVEVYCIWRQPGFDPSTSMALASAFRRLRVDIIHAHQCTPWFYCALSRLRYRKPRLLLEEHGRFYPESDNRLRRWVNRLLIRRLTHRFVAVSEDIRRRLVRFEGLDHDQIDTIYNGVQSLPGLAGADRAALKKGLGLSAGTFVVGTVGRFDTIKNLPMLVGAINSAAENDVNIRGLIVGDGPEFARIESLIAASEAQDRIVLTGFRSNARDLVQCMDLFVLSSFSEGTSMALLEAMAAEVPVAVTAVGGNPEIVVDGETGWVVPSDDVNALQAVLLEAAGDTVRAARLADAGRERFAEQFTFAGMIERYRVLYSNLVDTAGAS